MVCIGDVVRVGSAMLMVTQPRLPCYKLALRFGRDDIIQRFLVSRRSGFYLSVVEQGAVQVGSEVEILSRDPNRVTVANILQLYLGQTCDPELRQRALNLSTLPKSWKTDLLLKSRCQRRTH